MISIDFDFATLTEGLDQAGEEYRDALDKGFARAGLAVVHRFQDRQLSGRYGADLGLKVRTGNLRDSLRSIVTTEGDRVSATIYNQGASYWAYHQDGAGHNPKRLFLEEDFRGQGEQLFASQLDLALQVIA